MRTVIATIKPEHLGNIRSGKKLYEMRKTCPVEVPFRVRCITEFGINRPPQSWCYARTEGNGNG